MQQSTKLHIYSTLAAPAASALYIVCVMNGENLTQKMIAEAAGVTEVKIRNRYTELKKSLELKMT